MSNFRSVSILVDNSRDIVLSSLSDAQMGWLEVVGSNGDIKLAGKGFQDVGIIPHNSVEQTILRQPYQLSHLGVPSFRNPRRRRLAKVFLTFLPIVGSGKFPPSRGCIQKSGNRCSFSHHIHRLRAQAMCSQNSDSTEGPAQAPSISSTWEAALLTSDGYTKNPHCLNMLH